MSTAPSVATGIGFNGAPDRNLGKAALPRSGSEAFRCFNGAPDRNLGKEPRREADRAGFYVSMEPQKGI